jgi:hypothetical protein
MNWTVDSFIALLKKHGTLGPYVNPGLGSSHVLIDGYVNLESLVEELNANSTESVRSTGDRQGTQD